MTLTDVSQAFLQKRAKKVTEAISRSAKLIWLLA
jgi:hypothetical protein